MARLMMAKDRRIELLCELGCRAYYSLDLSCDRWEDLIPVISYNCWFQKLSQKLACRIHVT